MVAPTLTHMQGDIKINGVLYRLAPESTTDSEPIPVQPGEDEEEFERRILNLALGWGSSKWLQPGGYDYGLPANLHRRMAWLPGSAVTDVTPGTVPIGPTSFCEYWDGTAANRRLIVVSPRHVYEVTPAGAVSTNDLGVNFTTSRAMTKGVCYRNAGMAGTTKIFIARQSATATDYFVERTAANTYALTAANKMAIALGSAKDSLGADVLWRVTEAGVLNVLTADANPSIAGSWALATYPIGQIAARANDIVQQSRNMIVGREDGAMTFDNVSNSIPVTPGMEQTPDARQFMFFKDFGGLALAPTAQGIVWIDGLEWDTCGPIATNADARSLRGTEVAVSDQAGKYVYSAVYLSGTSYIFLGTSRSPDGREVGEGQFTWHGPIATVPGQISDLRASTVFGTKLWWGTSATFGYINLNPDFSPVPDMSTGYIYLPDGILDMDGPDVIKDLRKAEFIAPGDKNFAATNAWTIEVDVGAGFVAIDGGVVNSGNVADRFWSTETSGRRPRARLAYSGNAGAGELEQVIVRGTQRPETSDSYTVLIVSKDNGRLSSGALTHRTAEADYTALRALKDAGRKVVVVLRGREFTGKVVGFQEQAELANRTGAGERVYQVRIRRVKYA